MISIIIIKMSYQKIKNITWKMYYNDNIKEGSEWNKLYEELNEYTNISSDVLPIRLIEIKDLFFNQLKKDQISLQNNKNVSDCFKYITKRKLGDTTLYKLLSMEFNSFNSNNVDEKSSSYIKFYYILKSLKLKYISQINELINNKYELLEKRLNLRKNYCLLKNKPVSDAIKYPKPMDVKIPDNELFEPIFDYIKNGNEMVELKEFENGRGACFDKRVDFCKQVVPNINDLMNAMVNNPNIEHFELGNNVVGLEGAKAIASFIENKHKPKIKTWYLAGNYIIEKGIELIANALKTYPHTESLWLKRNMIGVKGTKHLGEMLEVNNNIEILDLHNTAIYDEGVQYLFESLKKNTGLRFLYLDANNITPEGCVYIADYFDYLVDNNLKGITSLYLSINRIDDEGAITLSKSISKYQYMERLSLGSNRIGNDGAKIVLECFKNHPNLKLLDLGYYKSTFDMGELPNNINNECIPIISDFIKNNKSVQIFSIMNNNINKFEDITDALEENDSILQFYYSQHMYKAHKSIKDRIKSKLDENIIKLGYDINNIKKVVRKIKHGDKIEYIDSIYRNNM